MAGIVLTLLTAICSFVLIPLEGVSVMCFLLFWQIFLRCVFFFIFGKLQILFTG